MMMNVVSLIERMSFFIIVHCSGCNGYRITQLLRPRRLSLSIVDDDDIMIQILHYFVFKSGDM